jgi:hypothetical protein
MAWKEIRKRMHEERRTMTAFEFPWHWIKIGRLTWRRIRSITKETFHQVHRPTMKHNKNLDVNAGKQVGRKGYLYQPSFEAEDVVAFGFPIDSSDTTVRAALGIQPSSFTVLLLSEASKVLAGKLWRRKKFPLILCFS